MHFKRYEKPAVCELESKIILFTKTMNLIYIVLKL